jgi:hypothetical protein
VEVEVVAEKENREPLLQFYQEQGRQLRFLTWLSLALFLFVVAFLAIHLDAVRHREDPSWKILACYVLTLAVAMVAGHINLRLSCTAWRGTFLMQKAERSLGLSPQLVPPSFRSYLPATPGEFLRQLFSSFHGSLFVMYLVAGWVAGVIHLPRVIDMPLSLDMAVPLVPPLLLGSLSLYVAYQDACRGLTALRPVVELAQPTGPEAAELSCDLAEVLLKLQPPRVMEALRQYHQALAVDAQNPRALQGIEKIMSWKTKEGKAPE